MGNQTIENALPSQISNLSPIQQYYQDKTVLLTGATGFFGKIVIDKLIRSCYIKQVYILVRTKKGKTAQQRVEELFKDTVFTRMKKEYPNYLDYIKMIPGDCSLPNLGLQPQDIKLLQENTQIIFHCAATVRFDEKLPLAVNINVRAVRDLIEISRDMPKLEAFVHVSTAYTNSNQPKIEEKFYKTPINGDNLIKLTECAGDKLCEEITTKVIGEWPNTYTFTKAIAENLLVTNGKGLPMVLFRPAIVIGTAYEPTPGWIDNIYGPTGVVVGVGAGLMRVMLADPDTVSDLVPVDLVVNSMIASAWDRAKNITTTIESPVYNYVSSKRNPINYQEFLNLNFKHGEEVPTPKSVWCYSLIITKYRWLYTFYCMLLHTFPAMLVDACLILTRNKPRATKIYQKIHKFTDVLAYFSLQSFNFDGDAVDQLWNKLSPEDKEIYKFDISKVDWNIFFKNNIWAIRENILKDTPDTIPEGHRRQRKLRMAHFTIKYLSIAFLAYFVYKFLTLVGLL